MTRRERKALAQKVFDEAFDDIDINDDVARALAVRSLCPCRGEQWRENLWGFIFAMCDDPSPLVRVEALHVIEDAIAHSAPNAHGKWFLWRATKDEDPLVRRFAKGHLKRIPNKRSETPLKRNKHSGKRRYAKR